MQLKTARLVLRPWQEEDAERLYWYARDPLVGPAAGWPPHTSVDNSLEIIRGVLSAPETYAVTIRETGEPVGSAGIMFGLGGHTAMTATEAEIGYWIGVPWWGRGLIPEAVECLLTRCFTRLGRTGVWCVYYDGNDKSRRVQEKCGFVYHHSVPEVDCALLQERRTEHFTYLSRQRWQELHR